MDANQPTIRSARRPAVAPPTTDTASDWARVWVSASKAILLGILMLQSVPAQSVECQRAYTALERAVCANTRLHSLQLQFESLARAAVAANRLDQAQLSLMKNRAASRCRSAVALSRCLTRQLTANIANLTESRDEPAIAAAIGDNPKNRHYSNADPALAETARGEMAMLEIIRRQTASSDEATRNQSREARRALRRIWQQACTEPDQHPQLILQLEWYGLSCGR